MLKDKFHLGSMFSYNLLNKSISYNCEEEKNNRKLINFYIIFHLMFFFFFL